MVVTAVMVQIKCNFEMRKSQGDNETNSTQKLCTTGRSWSATKFDSLQKHCKFDAELCQRLYALWSTGLFLWICKWLSALISTASAQKWEQVNCKLQFMHAFQLHLPPLATYKMHTLTWVVFGTLVVVLIHAFLFQLVYAHRFNLHTGFRSSKISGLCSLPFSPKWNLIRSIYR